MNKKIIFLLVTLLMLATTVFAATADVQLNGNIIDFTDSEGNKVDAQIINNRTLVPLRKIFEELGCNVEWEQDTRTATATKDNVKLILQIDNKNVKKIVDGKESTITLDVPPTIYNNRTLVPLRFIAESLEKQVGWDASNYTAIIIDYDYFVNNLKSKASAIYEIFNGKYDDFGGKITRTYVDKLDDANNNSAVVEFNVSKTGENYNLKLNFSGNNDLMNDIVAEGWSNIDLNAKYSEDAVTYSTTNTTLAKMLGINTNETQNVSYEELNLEGSANDSLAKMIQNIIDIKDNELNVNSFANINSEWNNIVKNLGYENLDDKKVFTVSDVYSLDIKYFDLTKLDNIVYGSDISKIYNLVNKKIFRYDVNLEELLYDMNSIIIRGSIENDGKQVNIYFVGNNEYDEEISYTINLNVK